MKERDQGFTLIELMVVVLIIAILLAVAVPTFLGARQRANDRAAQSNLRNANTNALVYYADGDQQFTHDTGILALLDPSLTYTNSLAAATTTVVYVEVPPLGIYSPADTVYMATRSTNGPCFWIRSVGDKSEPRFAQNDCGSRPADATFTDAW